MSDCEICNQVLSPTDLMQEIIAKHDLKFVVSDDQQELLLVPIEDNDNAEHA